ncbi:MAG: nucleotidyl transferase AbiEii/AbiGii toxin family protein [bacterium]
MIEIIKQQFSQNMSTEEKTNRAREFLQIAALKIIYEKKLFDNITFTGGTSLRVLFNLRRFSEDLDFSLSKKKGYDFAVLNSELINGFSLQGLKVESSFNEEKTVHSAMFKFTGLLKDLGLSPLKEQKLSIKIEVDSNPPDGGHIQNTFVNKIYLFNVAHFDLPSMLATKLHACFYRKFTKGRDFYDFFWYLGNKIKPNFTLFNNAVLQTEGYNPEIDEGSFKKFLMENIEKVDFDKAKKDVVRFLEDKSEINLFDLKVLKSAIESVW